MKFFPILLKGKYSNKRRDMQIKLEKSGIQTRTVFTGNISRQPVAKKFQWTSYGKLHNADKIMRSGLLIGCHELISKKNIDFIKEKLSEFFN